jgi:hypothetical protein
MYMYGRKCTGPCTHTHTYIHTHITVISAREYAGQMGRDTCFSFCLLGGTLYIRTYIRTYIHTRKHRPLFLLAERNSLHTYIHTYIHAHTGQTYIHTYMHTQATLPAGWEEHKTAEGASYFYDAVSACVVVCMCVNVRIACDVVCACVHSMRSGCMCVQVAYTRLCAGRYIHAFNTFC